MKYVSEIFNTFRIVYWLEKVSFDVYIIIYYVCIFLIFVVIIDFIYVAYSYNQRKFAFIWPIQLLKLACIIMTTIIYIPLLGIQIHALNNICRTIFIIFKVLNAKRNPNASGIHRGGMLLEHSHSPCDYILYHYNFVLCDGDNNPQVSL
jgi:hypothetical protein